MNKTLIAAIGLLLTLHVPAPRADPSTDELHLRAGRAHVLALRAAEAFEAGSREASQQLRRDLLAFAGASRLAAEALTSPELTTTDLAAWTNDLRTMADATQASFDRSRTQSSTREAWAETRRALLALTDPRPLGASSGGESSTTTPFPPLPTSPPTPEPVADPDAPRALIVETRWAGTFTPDLVVTGRLEGRGLRSGVLVLKDRSGRERMRAEKEIAEAIAAATAGGPADALATAVFSVRFDDDDMASGENTIVLSVTDSRGRTAEESRTFTKRFF